MNRFASLLLACLCFIAAPSPVFAGPDDATPRDRKKILNEIKEYKHEFLIKELSLSKEQQAAFFDVYDKMSEEIHTLYHQTNKAERRLDKETDASTQLADSVAAAVYNLKANEGRIEQKYFPQIRQVLSPRQIIRLKAAEQKFTQQLIMHHRRLKGNKQPHKKQ